MNENLIILVATGPSYKIYVPYYIACLAYTNPECDILVFTDDSIVKNFDRALDIAKKMFRNKIEIIYNKQLNNQIVNFSYPDFCRALVNPKYYDMYKYVYIGDIDLLITETNIFKKHIDHTEKLGISFSNWARYPLSLKRMSGLHFINVPEYLKRYRQKIEYYIENKNLLVEQGFKNDEDSLYFILDEDEKSKCNKILYRNFHGIHLGALRTYDGTYAGLISRLLSCTADGSIVSYIKDILIIIQKEEFKNIHDLLQDFKVNLLYTIKGIDIN